MLINSVQGPVTDVETGKVFDYILHYDDADDNFLTPGSSRTKLYAGGGDDFEGGSSSNYLYSVIRRFILQPKRSK